MAAGGGTHFSARRGGQGDGTSFWLSRLRLPPRFKLKLVLVNLVKVIIENFLKIRAEAEKVRFEVFDFSLKVSVEF